MQRSCSFILRTGAIKIQPQIIKVVYIKINSLRENVRKLRKGAGKRISSIVKSKELLEKKEKKQNSVKSANIIETI